MHQWIHVITTKEINWKDAAERIGIASIVVYLGLVASEVRQNTRAIEQEAAVTYAASSIAVNLFVAGDSDFSRLIIKSGMKNFRLRNG